MKKTGFVLIFAAVIMMLAAVGEAELTPLIPTGPTTENSADFFEEWSANSRVSKLLTGNYAFVDGVNTIWEQDKKANTKVAPYLKNGEMYISAEDAQVLFGVTSGSGDVSLSQIAQTKGLSIFIDPIGFALLSENADAVNITPNGAKGYKDYYTVSDAMGFLSWTDVSADEFARKAYISKWQGLLTIPHGYEGNAVEDYKEHIRKKAVDSRDNIYGKLNLDNTNENVPFTDIVLDDYLDGTDNDVYNRNLKDYASGLSKCYENLLYLAKYYKYFEPSNETLRDDILGALEYLLENHYSKEINRKRHIDTEETTGAAWTVYQLTIPFTYSNILCLMYDDMTQEEVTAHTNAIFDHSIDPTVRNAGYTYEYYTNRMWRTLGYFNTAVLAGDFVRMNYAMRYLNQIFTMIPDKSELTYPEDGFYSDGSFVFHNYIAYNLGYGDGHLTTLGEMAVLTEDTPFSVEKVYGFENIYTFLEKSIFPFFTDNIEMKAVVGRSEALGDGLNVVKGALNIIDTADENVKTRLMQELKRSFYKYLGNYENFTKLVYTGDMTVLSGAARDILYFEKMENLWEKVEALPGEAKSDIFYNMDRAVWRNDDYTAALSMSSERILKYEADDNQNLKGWYTGDGMLYIYTGDGKQYTETYFNKVNPLRIPGTTVDETKRSEVETPSTLLSDNAWAGGATDGETAVCAYELSNAPLADVAGGIQIEGRKSYFFLNGRIICIGSGISGGKGEVCTVVDNRLIELK